MQRHMATRSEWGLIYGMLAGAALGLLLLALTGEPLWLLLVGVGITLGYGLGAT